MPRPGPRIVTLPNGLSVLRLVLAPVLLVLAHNGASQPFLAVLIVTLLSDVLDGKLARWLDQRSELGARLDSWGDLATYAALPVCAYWLRPELLERAAPFFWAVVGAYAIPIVIGVAKFRSLTSYHTRGAVIAAYLLGSAAVILFAGGPIWPFQIAAVVLVLAELEEIAITLTLPVAITDVKSLGRARELRDRVTQRP